METNLINIIPEGVEPIYHVSQGDTGRQIRCNLTQTLTGSEGLVLRYRKSNNAFGSVPVASTSGSSVDIDIPEDMTDLQGFVYCKLRIDGIGAKAFGILVEGRP